MKKILKTTLLFITIALLKNNAMAFNPHSIDAMIGLNKKHFSANYSYAVKNQKRTQFLLVSKYENIHNKYKFEFKNKFELSAGFGMQVNLYKSVNNSFFFSLHGLIGTDTKRFIYFPEAYIFNKYNLAQGFAIGLKLGVNYKHYNNNDIMPMAGVVLSF